MDHMLPPSDGNGRECHLSQLMNNPFLLKTWQAYIQNLEKSSLHGQVDADFHLEFLSKFPFLSDYWLSEATRMFMNRDQEHSLLLFTKARRLGFADIGYWIQYVKHKIETASLEDLWQIFEDARLNIGYSYFGFEFYILYFEFLDSQLQDGLNTNMREMLLRSLIEIPLFSFSSLFELIKKSRSSLAFGMTSFSYLSTPKAASNLSDCYAYMQAHTYELYPFEKDLALTLSEFSGKADSRYIQSWFSLIGYAESTTNARHVENLCQRALWDTSYQLQICEQFFEALLRLGKRRAAVELIKTCCNVNFSTHLLMRYIDFELWSGNFLRASSVITEVLRCNSAGTVPMYEKFLEIESLFQRLPEEGNRTDEFITSVADSSKACFRTKLKQLR